MTLPPAVPAPDRHYPPVARRSRRRLWLVLAIIAAVVVVVALVVYLAGRTDRERHANIDAVGAAADHCGVGAPSGDVTPIGEASVDRENGRIEFSDVQESAAGESGQSWADVECVGAELGLPDDVLATMQEPGSESYGSDEGYRWGPYWVTWHQSTAGDHSGKDVQIYHDWQAAVYDD